MEAIEAHDQTNESKTSYGLLIKEVFPDSPAVLAGIEAGDRLVSINGFVLRDLIDLEFCQSDSEILVEYRRQGQSHQVEIEKDPDTSLGIVVDPPPIRRCPNDCEFCFVDQMPEGARKSLYIRDEDYRYSFLYGNFITLTNLTEKDYVRILEQRLSPLYISVHATPRDIRRKILKNEKAPDILPLLRRLSEGGITLHTQVVLTPGVNDQEVLERTWRDLLDLYPGVGSLAVVPVGLTAHREGLPDLPLIDSEYAAKMLKILSSMQKASIENVGDPFIFPADEWYVLSGRSFPSLSRYGDLPQLGNGVGLVPLFQRQWKKSMRALRFPLSKRLVLVTGMAFSPYLRELTALFEKSRKSGKEELTVLPVVNRYLGPTVTVAGLLSSRDIIAAVRETSLPEGSCLCIPEICLRDGTDILIDDGSIGEIAGETGLETVAVPSSAREFLLWIRETLEEGALKEASA
ncbi:MAG: DUF512 domain-containing protein [Nitrospirae bacterium]|nr:DUF512 domain-containing protein [Nitrospirota bacterium]MCL5286222.1 DUF512 domain-containing protein [Nitrospirota bacterium]